MGHEWRGGRVYEVFEVIEIRGEGVWKERGN